MDQAFIKAFQKRPADSSAGDPADSTRADHPGRPTGPEAAPVGTEAAPVPAAATRPGPAERGPEAPAEPGTARTPIRIRKVAQFTLPNQVRAMEQIAGPQFQTLSQILRRAQQQAGLKSLLFTSCYRGEGRTCLLIALARALPRVVRARTVLVDADFLNPGIGRELGLEVAVGLDDIVVQGRRLEEALIVSQNDAFAVLPLRRHVAKPREFIRAPRLVKTLVHLRHTFDLVLLDASPIFSSLDPTVLHEQVDGAVLVVNREMTEDASVRRARHILESAGLTVLGIAETFV